MLRGPTLKKRLFLSFDYIIPPIVVLFLSWVWYLCCFEIGYGYIFKLQDRPFTAVVYILQSTTLIPFILTLFLSLVRIPRSFGVPPVSLRAPEDLPYYECDRPDGELDFCSKGNCNGRWKPPRTHHCSLCDVCRLGFDHHCPWVGRCVTLPQMKTFLTLLFITPLTLLILIYPVFPLLITQASAALDSSYKSEWAQDIWWNRWYSWILLAGPPGRWIVGTILGYRILDRPNCEDSFGCLMVISHIRVLLTALYSLLLGLFSLGLGIGTSRRLHRGLSSVEASKARCGGGSYICINSGRNTVASHSTAVPPTYVYTSPTERKVLKTLLGERPYDLGSNENWKNVWTLPLFCANTDGAVIYEKNVLPRLNPIMLRRMLSTH